MARVTDGDSRTALVVGVVAVIALSFGVNAVVVSTVTGDPGSMDRAFGQLYGSVFVLGSGAALWWVARQLRGFDSRSRRRVIAVIATAGAISVLVFGFLAFSSVVEHHRRTRALDATASWRHDFEADLADAYWAWYQDHGGTDQIYTGDMHEWCSLDPDEDGIRDTDAPILRALRVDDWSDRGLAIFDSDNDQLIDHIEWAMSSGLDESNAWCIPVSEQRNIILAEWSDAVSRECEGSKVLPAAMQQ